MTRFFILFLFIPISLYSQVSESFNDGNFTSSPQWTGDDSYFIVNPDLVLQLNDTEARTANLSTVSTVAEEAVWQFRVKMDFNPSSSNLARVYLMSNSSALTLATNAVFIELGNTNDNICLYKVENGNTLKLIEGQAGRLNINSIDVVIRVKRESNNWSIESDMGAGWQGEGSATFEANFPSAYFGFYCKYTVTRADKFFFDDIAVSGKPFTDIAPPTITSFNLVNGSTMQLTMSEALNTSSIRNENFRIKGNDQNPVSATFDVNNNSITLRFDPPLTDTDDNELQVSGLSDVDGNVMQSATFPFSYNRNKVTQLRLIDGNTLQLSFSKPVPPDNLLSASMLIDEKPVAINSIETNDNLMHTINLTNALTEAQSYHFSLDNLIDAIGDQLNFFEESISFYHPKRFDVVFNEWMADPSPALDLPEVEYIELFNTTTHKLSLNNWRLMIADKAVDFPDAEIESGGLVCLVNTTHSGIWPEDIPTIFINNLPALSNAGCDLVLISNDNKIMDAYTYQPSIIPGETFKNEGGWSVERLDPTNVSGDASNFHWSMYLAGGTPGKVNSVHQENKDTKNPTVISLQLQNDQSLVIKFSESMQLAHDALPVSFTPELTIQHQSYDTIFLNQLTLNFQEPLNLNQVHQINSITLNDWAGHPLVLTNPLKFGVADSLEAGDILINEVLFNPYPNGYDFVEIYNQSHKIIDLSSLYLAEMNDEEIEKLYPTANKGTLIFPQSYAALSKDTMFLKQFYDCRDETTLTEMNTMPSYPDDEGKVILTNKYGQVLDVFEYNEAMHFDLLKDKEGVSLERLSWLIETNREDNWHSAASTAGFATPGYLNSQQLPVYSIPEEVFSVTPEVFTPNADGMDDWLTINYANDEPGTTATIRIYDANGNEVRYLVNNQTLAANGFFTWDGLSDERVALRPGIYIVYFQCVYTSGKVLEEKRSCVISTQGNN